MRLDKFLKVSRLIKRRTIANEICDLGKVTLNGNVAKASSNVKAGDLLVITLGNRTIKAKIVNVLETANKEESSEMYEIII